MFSNTNSNRIISCNTLYIKSRYSISIRSTHYTRSKLRMTYTKSPCKRSINILLIYIPTYRTRSILWIIFHNRNLKHRCNYLYCNNSNSIYRICATLRTNKILRSNSNYKPIFSNSIYRHNISRMNLRGVRSRQPYIKPIFCTTFHTTICSHSTSNNSYCISSPNRIK